ncbi:MAG: hypothetical protein EOP61_02245 [Sphingomonadales bacterium]|nr:MAG: hypothetical protein EOP61_02245 [Sphingomonadales bacterium]
MTAYAKPLFNLPITEVDTEAVLEVLKPIWLTKAETASRVRPESRQGGTAALRPSFGRSVRSERRLKAAVHATCRAEAESTPTTTPIPRMPSHDGSDGPRLPSG